MKAFFDNVTITVVALMFFCFAEDALEAWKLQNLLTAEHDTIAREAQRHHDIELRNLDAASAALAREDMRRITVETERELEALRREGRITL